MIRMVMESIMIVINVIMDDENWRNVCWNFTISAGYRL